MPQIRTKDRVDDEPEDSLRTSLEVRFAGARPYLNARRRQMLRAILDNPEETFFLSSRELAARYKVDAATVVRTIQALGYKRFADFTADLRRHFIKRVTPYSIMKATTREKRSLPDHVAKCLERDAENLRVLRATLDEARVIELAKLIHKSKRIMVAGVDLAASLAWFLAYGLTPLGFLAEAPVGSAGNLQHRADLLTEGDLLIAISFGRCLRETVDAAKRARERGAKTFAITDSDSTPLALHCDSCLIASIASPSITGSYAAPMALINAILVSCAHLHPRRSLERLREIENEYTSGPRWYEEQRSPRGRGGTSAKE